MEYLYPDNLKAKAQLWLWEMRDAGILSISILLSVFALAQTDSFFLIVLSAVYGFLTIRFEDISILDFIRYAVAYFFLTPRQYEWRPPNG